MLHIKGHSAHSLDKALLREMMWFQCMDKMVEEICLLCQIVTLVYTREQLQMSVPTDNPFDEVSVHFAYITLHEMIPWKIQSRDIPHHSLNQGLECKVSGNVKCLRVSYSSNGLSQHVQIIVWVLKPAMS